MTSTQVVETSVTTTDNSPTWDYTHTNDHVTPDSNHLIYCILLLSWSEDRTEIQRCELEFQRKHEWDTNTIASTVIKFLMVMCGRKYREPFPF